MSFLDHLDQIFDLDIALTTSSATAENSGVDDEIAKLADSISSVQSPQIELPVVTAVGVCTVCIESFKPTAKGNQAPCGHVFHESCIHKWLSLHNSCPLCRFDIAGAAAVQDYNSVN